MHLLIRKYNIDNWINKTFCDGSSPGNIRSLKNAISGTNETVDYHLLVNKATEDKRPLDLYMQIVSINFSTDAKQMAKEAKEKAYFIFSSIEKLTKLFNEMPFLPTSLLVRSQYFWSL